MSVIINIGWSYIGILVVFIISMSVWYMVLKTTKPKEWTSTDWGKENIIVHGLFIIGGIVILGLPFVIVSMILAWIWGI